MKKANRKLVLRSETLRELSSIDLARAVGGFQSTDNPCLLVVAYQTGDHQCPAQAAPTAACG